MPDLTIAQRLSAHPRYQARPGEARQDPETGDVWRRIYKAWIRERDLGIVVDGWDPGWFGRDLTRALAAGPMDDPATNGGLLAAVREVWIADDCFVRKTVDLNGTCWVVESWIVRGRMDEAAGGYTAHGVPAVLGPDELGKRAATEHDALCAAVLAGLEW